MHGATIQGGYEVVNGEAMSKVKMQVWQGQVMQVSQVRQGQVCSRKLNEVANDEVMQMWL